MTSRSRALIAGLLGLLALAAIAAFALTALSPTRTDRTVTFLSVNDIYRLGGVGEGKSGGLTRLRTLRRWIERDAPEAILLHAGDFLSPSLQSKVFKGAQMIEVMNGLGGEGGAFDNRMFVTFGNHEFDESRCDRANAPLNARVAEARFTWLVTNLDFAKCASMSGIRDQANVKDSVVIDVNGVKVGIFGIGQTPDKVGLPRYPTFEEGLPAARRSVEDLRKAGAELIVGLTHLPREDDEALLKALAPAGLDFIAGGHDHDNMVLFDQNGVARGFKADSDARTAWRIDAEVPKGGRARVRAQLITINDAIPPDPALDKLAMKLSAEADAKICAERGMASPDCLATPIGRTQGPIHLEENANRSQETGFGDWLADLVVRQTGADVGLINSGTLGLNEDLGAGTLLRLRHIVDIFRFDGPIAVREFPARQVCAAINHGFATPGMGAWPHVGGLEVTVKRESGKYAGATVTRFRNMPGVTCDSDTPVKVAALPFVLCSGDGYALLPASDACLQELEAKPLGDERKGELMSKMAEQAIRDAGDAGIRPEKDGRIRFIETGGK